LGQTDSIIKNTIFISPFTTGIRIVEIYDFRNGASNSSLHKDGLSYVLDSVWWWNEKIQPPEKAQDSKWIDITSIPYNQRYSFTYGSFPFRKTESDDFDFINSFILNAKNTNNNLQIICNTSQLQSIPPIFQTAATINIPGLGPIKGKTVYKLILKVRDSTNFSNGNYGNGSLGWNKISVFVIT
jgi:hypothetical protein